MNPAPGNIRSVPVHQHSHPRILHLLRAIQHVDDPRRRRVTHARPAQQPEEAPREVRPHVTLDVRAERRARRVKLPPTRYPFVGVINPILERHAHDAQDEAKEEREHRERVHLLQREPLQHETGKRVTRVLVHGRDERQGRESDEASLRWKRDRGVVLEEAVRLFRVEVVRHEEVENCEARE